MRPANKKEKNQSLLATPELNFFNSHLTKYRYSKLIIKFFLHSVINTPYCPGYL